MTRFLDEVVDNLEDVLRSHGFVRCDIPACNCGSWHPRYGLYERWQEIKDALEDADVLNNETGNLPLRAVKLLIEQRDALRQHLHDEHQRHVVTMDERDALQADLAAARAYIARLHVSLDASQANDHRYCNVPDGEKR